MKLVLFHRHEDGSQDGTPFPGLLTERGVIDISGVVRSNHTPQLVMEGIIDDFDTLRPTLETLVETTPALADPFFCWPK